MITSNRHTFAQTINRVLTLPYLLFFLSLILGAGIGYLLGHLYHVHSAVATMGVWLLGVSGSLLGTGWIGSKLTRRPLWHFLMWGQLTAMGSIILFMIGLL